MSFDLLRCPRALAIVASSFLLTAPAAASTPTLLWQGARSLAVQCLVQRGSLKNDLELGSALCTRVARLAARGASLPVSVVAIGDPAVMAPGTVALLVHGSVESVRGNRVLAFSLRPLRVSAGQSAMLFSAAPRAVALSNSGIDSPALDPALIAALSDTLPWQARPQGARALPTRD